MCANTKTSLTVRREGKRGKEKNKKQPTQCDVSQPAVACHTPPRLCRSQSSDSIHQARQTEGSARGMKREWRGKQRQGGGGSGGAAGVAAGIGR